MGCRRFDRTRSRLRNSRRHHPNSRSPHTPPRIRCRIRKFLRDTSLYGDSRSEPRIRCGDSTECSCSLRRDDAYTHECFNANRWSNSDRRERRDFRDRILFALSEKGLLSGVTPRFQALRRKPLPKSVGAGTELRRDLSRRYRALLEIDPYYSKHLAQSSSKYGELKQS